MAFWDSGRRVAGGVMVADGLFGIDTPGRKRPGLLGSVLAVVFGVIFIGVGIFVHKQMQPFPDGTAASGTVVSVRTQISDKGRAMYSRVVGFRTSDGRDQKFDEQGSSSSKPVVGSHVQVSYRPANPGEARIVGENAWIPWLFIGAGGLVALIGLVTFVVRVITIIFGLGLLFRRS